jgi:hypothetical protein
MRALTVFGNLMLATALLASLTGCGASGPPVHRVQGTVQLTDGNVSDLAGHTLEAVLENDSTIRAYGAIGEDGRFQLESLLGGQIRPGAMAGKYVVRLVLGDDDPELRKRAAQAVNKRFLNTETSGLSISVPASGDVTLSLSRS